MDKEIQQAIYLLQQHGYEVIMPQSVTEINEEFEYWWQLYNKKRGKDKCAKRWARLSKKTDKLALLLLLLMYNRCQINNIKKTLLHILMVIVGKMK